MVAIFNCILAEFRHETNTFSTDPTDLECFRRRSFAVGEEIIPYYTGVKAEMGGFLEVLTAQEDVCILPVIAANAMPSGRVTDAMFAMVRDALLDAIQKAERVDGILLSLHGAMATESSEDGEGDLLALLREAVGPSVPIVATLDLHSNLTEKMSDNCDVLINYDSYPHSDMYERGLEAAWVLLKTLRGELKPVMRCARRPLLLASLPSAWPAMQVFVDQMHAYEADPRVVAVSISHAFFCTDVPGTRLTVVAVTDNEPELAQQLADELADGIWEARAKLYRTQYKADEAIVKAMAADQGPVILADVADNPGGGSPCDGTHLLRAMIAHDVQDAAVALIYDPESVDAAEKAGVGNTVRLRLGGKCRPEILGEPIECEAYVKLLSDGRYRNDGPMSGGLLIDLIKTAVVVIGGIEVIVTSNVTQPYDVQIFRAHGIEPTRKKILMIKSTVHFRAAFEPLAKEILDVECPGLLPQDPRTLPYKRIQRPIYPLDEI